MIDVELHSIEFDDNLYFSFVFQLLHFFLFLKEKKRKFAFFQLLLEILLVLESEINLIFNEISSIEK